MSGGWNLDLAEGRVPSAQGWPRWAVPVWTEPDVDVPVGDKLSSCLGCFGLCRTTSFHFRLVRSWWWAFSAAGGSLASSPELLTSEPR